MNSNSSNLMGYCTLAIEFFLLKNHTSYYYINSFSLLWISFFLSHSLSIASQCSHIIEQANMKRKKKEKKKKKKQADLTQPGGGEEDERRWGGGRGSATPALSFQRPIDPPALSSLSLSLSLSLMSRTFLRRKRK